MTRLVFRLSSGQAVSDTQTGLRAFTDELTDRLLKISGERYEYEMNMLMICAREHVPMHEVKIETIYINDNASSHFSPIKDSLRIYGEILKFSASSLSCFALDYVLYCLLIALSGSEVLANVAARLVSSFVNFTFTRMFVFPDKGHIAKAAVQYFALAALILGGNTVLLYILVDLLGMNSYVAKLITELCLFLISWTVQHCVIFRKKTSRPV
ncbi:MAG: GtrA family protein [Oscillospiraceae bacterium]|nr:GtrA family protein [Oscillospiraceae bacterium]